MTEKIENAKKFPSVFYGLHFSPGVAEYVDAKKESFRILINENAAKKMDQTFVGKPVFVEHVDEVNLDNIQNEADGYVIESFYNRTDGKHWVKFIVVSDRGHDAIRSGWKLSNAYIPTSFGPGGLWHAVEFSKEVMDGEYEHLAIVKDPRYAESIILTPDEFKNYNETKEIELKKFANSKQEKSTMKLNIFKRTKVENSKEIDFEGLEVELPLSKKSMTLSAVVNELDKVLNMHGYASDEHMVKVNDKEEMSVKDLRDCYGKMKSDMEAMKKNAESEDMDDEAMENEEVSEPTKGDELGEAKEDKMYENEKEPKESNFEKLKNAHKKVINQEPELTILDGVERGKKLFGA